MSYRELIIVCQMLPKKEREEARKSGKKGKINKKGHRREEKG